MNSKPVPTEKNFSDIRKERQRKNDENVYECLSKGNKKTLVENININTYHRIIEEIRGKYTEDEFLKRCETDDLIARITSMYISKNASRQGSKDEAEQLALCGETGEKCGIIIRNCSSREVRPTKDGSIISNNEMKKRKISKDCCLKSFDAQISGKFCGYITAKVVYGNGGHQDNVFEEMDTMAEWWKKYKSEKEEILIVLIDTDLNDKFSTIKDKYSNVDNVKVFNHVEFQQYMIDTYYTEESI